MDINDLRRPGGKMELKPEQALMLQVAAENHGLVAQAGVGMGKTLVSLLLPVVVGAKRPLLVVPAAVIPQLKKEAQQYGQHWRIAACGVISYELLSSPNQKNLLAQQRPDCIIFDEADKLRSHDTQRIKQVNRYLNANPGTKVFALSGTLISHSVLDVCHWLAWALKDASPIPKRVWNGLSSVLDSEGKRHATMAQIAGALKVLDAQKGEVQREAWKRLLNSTPGVVLFESSTPKVKLDIKFRDWTPPARAEVDVANGDARQAICGFEYLPKLPTDQPGTRRARWFYSDFVDDVVKLASALCAQGRTPIIWVVHRAVGARLSKMTGWPWYSSGSEAKVLQAGSSRPAIVSIYAGGRGLNLQGAWNTSIYAGALSDPAALEQSLGRLHRPGQKTDVEVWLYEALVFDTALDRAKHRSEWLFDVTGQAPRILTAED